MGVFSFSYSLIFLFSITKRVNFVNYNSIHIKLENSQLTTKLIEGNYPNYKQVIPKEAEQRIKVERELMLDAVQRSALMASDKQKLVRLKMLSNSLEISCQSADVGNSVEPIEVEYDGPEIQIGFNPDFLEAPLRNLTKDEIYFEFKDENTPGVFKTLDNFLCVVMPMRL